MRKARRIAPPRHIGPPRHSVRLAPRSTRRTVSIALAVAAGGFAIAAMILGLKVMQVKHDLDSLQTATGTLKTELANKDFVGLKATIQQVSDATQRASVQTNSIPWRVSELVPVVGQNLSAVRVVNDQTYALMHNLALPALAVLPSDGKLPKGADGNIDASFIKSLAPLAQSASSTVVRAQSELHGARSPLLASPVAAAVTKVSGLIDKVAPVAANAPDYLKVTRALLGMDKPITLALVSENNAEVSALGGNSEQITIMSIDQGKATITRQVSQADMPIAPVPSPVDPEALKIYSNVMLTWANAATFRPDFPTTATLLTEHLQTLGITPDVYISVDPTALAKVLSATGPLQLATGDVLTADNAVSLLLNEVYLRYPVDTSEKTDAFFSSAASEVFTAVKSGNFNVSQMYKSIRDGVNQGSIMLWFRDPSIQSLIDHTPLSGQLTESNTPSTEVGVYFRDNSSSKIDYYLQTDTKINSNTCNASGQVTADVMLHSNLTEAQAKALPDYVKSGIYGWESFRTEVLVFAPIGAKFDALDVVQQSKTTALDLTSADLGRNVAKFVVDLRPGETAAIRATMSGASSPSGPVVLRTTPMINGTNSVTQPHC